METIYSYDLNQLESVSHDILRAFDSKVVVFIGEMGSGKTTLVKALLKQMGGQDTGNSPSFSLVNEYETDEGTVYHFDLYRINDVSEIWDMGFEDYLSAENWLFIEWPELILDQIPSDFNKIEIQNVSEMSRSLKLTINNTVLT
ncbi:tRNA (adenosine(37)-N6)-threonylcarbamoyltransferase complex ATPase subunit type 1 TsaE [Winogradskyella aurantiaca]|uniref:tRNA (adenosine(37)-N6)-threonylcarbamoyltransferase complex ATPase subunit type 1 TsaE n=1 Tax=Winogradskyella aurantiaca TaxID=2219558 RepID=UPI000E1D73AC|nr:tRNA (adenosine(37)-N6)-threonylcarbamoyltransferase complex ATPase subunit type 1 TsaE [Winogradskyella aurantiaca]